jgi:hypothetical protein
MKRLSLLFTMVAAIALPTAAVASGGDDHGNKKQTLKVVERTTAIAFIEAPPQGDSLGDYVIIASDLFDETKTQKIGTSEEACFRTVVGKSRQCFLTYFFRNGFLTLQGQYRDDGTGTFAITGGNGIYRRAHGYMDVLSTTPTDGGQIFEYVEVFHIIP